MSDNQNKREEVLLVAAAVAGDTSALAELLRVHGPRLRDQLSIDRRWRSVLDPDDILQVTYLEAFLKISSFIPGERGVFYSWLRRIAENNLLDAIKGLEAQKRPPPAVVLERSSGDASTAGLFELLGIYSATPSRVAAIGEMTAALRNALEALPRDYAEVIRAYDLEGCEIAEVAARMERSIGAVHMLRARAHDRLRELLGSSENYFSTPA